MQNRNNESRIKKLKTNLTEFIHHRDGWKYASNSLKCLHDPNGILFLDWADKVFKECVIIKEPWIGIFHNTLTYPQDYPEKYKNKIFCIKDLVEKKYFKESLNYCEGIFTLCKHTANFLKRNTKVLVENIKHPINNQFNVFDYSKLELRISTIGQWLRKYHSIFELECPDFEKQLIKINGFENDYKEMKKYVNQKNIKLINYLSNDEYDNLLSSSIVFLDLYDCSACNVLLECLIRNTPILINPLPAVLEYLGPKYPFYFRTIKEAQDKLNKKSILKTHEYLKNMNKKDLTSEAFIENIYNSEIYKLCKCEQKQIYRKYL